VEEQMIETVGMHLANRAYLYRVFHIVFGAEPSSDELGTLASQTTVEAFQYLSGTNHASYARFEIGAQETIQKVSAAETLSCTTKFLISLGKKMDDVEYLESLRSDFMRLFLVPGNSYVYPWESPYVGKEMMLFQENTLDVRRRYREYGFTAMEYGHFPEDHLSMMLDFLAHLSSRAFDAFGDGDDEDVRRVLFSQGEFISTHLTNWLSDFYKDLSKKDISGVYRQFADALRAFLETDKLFIEDTLDLLSREP
jgi:TorA maturation chaperone TorD